MFRGEHLRAALAATTIGALVAAPACRFDPDRPAPYVAPPNALGACGSTESLLPRLLQFTEDDGFAGLRVFVQRHLVPSEGRPYPDVSLRTLLGALIGLATSFGLDRTRDTAELAARSQSLRELEPLVLGLIRFIEGGDGQPDHYEAGDAAAHFVRVCKPDHLLVAIESVLRLRSPSSGGRLWLDALAEAAFVLLENPLFEPFLQTFEQESARGRPAIVALVAQIMGFLKQDDFHISRVDTLLESVVYPIVDEALRNDIQRLVVLLEEATAPEAGILVPIQRAVRCGMDHPPERDVLIGFLYDFVVSDAVGLDGLLRSIEGLVTPEDAERVLGALADAIENLRTDTDDRDDILALLVLLLSQPDSRDVLPALRELVEAGVVFELLDAVVRVLSECEDV